MRVALFAESFLPNMNGVTHSLLRVLKQLQIQGDQALVIAPSTADPEAPAEVYGAAVHRVPALPLAGYRDLRVAFG